jgi:asparagine synthase (glutamine-hydrolysing)
MSGHFALIAGCHAEATDDAFVRWSRPPARGDNGLLVADATLYYRTDLHRRIGHGDFPDDATRILGAFRSLGDEALHALEGDFAFAHWDPRRARLLAARDFGGKRALYYAWHGQQLRMATSVAALLDDGILPRDVDLGTVATIGAGLWSHGAGTGYRHIAELPAGHVLHWSPGGAPSVRAFWRAPTATASRRRSLDDGADELRGLLEAAVRERLDPSGTTAVTLSGGWDSTAVYGIAQSIAAQRSTSVGIQGVSISYPPGDPGHEDPFIEQVTRRWNAEPDFIPIDSIPLLVDPEGHAARRASPFAHTYEQWNRALSRRASALNCRVVLDGIGGDQLFQCSDIFLADLIRSGQLVEAWRQSRARDGATAPVRHLYRWGVYPNLSPAIANLINRARGQSAPMHYLERRAPIWFKREFLSQHDVLGRDEAARPPLPRESFVLAEATAYLRFAFYPRIFGMLFDFAREEGVELRSPLLDERVVRFAVARPWSDRVDGAETKRSLRRAVRGLVPDSVLAPRARRTGTTDAYFLREVRRIVWPLAQRLLPTMRLVELGMVDPIVYARAWEHVLQHDDDELALRAYFTLQAELWIRSRTA